MRAAGCVINDYADRKVDGAVRRTAHRPLPQGEITPQQALMLFFVLLTVALGLVLMLNKLTVLFSIGGLLLAASYPFLKRLTHLPQLGLGAAWAWTIPMAFVAERQALPPALWLLFTAVILWTVAFDTYYAMVDRDDDVKVGIKSSAILFGRYDLAVIVSLQIATLVLLSLVGIAFDRGLYYALGLIIAAASFVKQYVKAKDRSEEGCFSAFLDNHRVGMIIFIGLAMDYQFTMAL